MASQRSHSSSRASLERFVGVLGLVKKAMGQCTAQCKMLLFHARTIVRGPDNTELARLKKKKEERRKKNRFRPFCEFLVWYLRDAFSRNWESCWSWKHSTMNGTLLWRLISLPFLRFWEIFLYCHILHVRAIQETREGWSHKTIKYTAPLQGSFSILRVYRKKICRGLCIQLLYIITFVSVLFVVLLSLHLVTFQMFFLRNNSHRYRRLTWKEEGNRYARPFRSLAILLVRSSRLLGRISWYWN